MTGKPKTPPDKAENLSKPHDRPAPENLANADPAEGAQDIEGFDKERDGGSDEHRK